MLYKHAIKNISDKGLYAISAKYHGSILKVPGLSFSFLPTGLDETK